MTASIQHVGDKLVVGALDMSFLDATSRLVPGTTVLNGPVYIGLTASVGVPRATCMIGPPIGLGIPASLEVTGITNLLSVTNQIGVSNRFGLSNIFGFTSRIGAVIKAAFSASIGVSAKAAVQTQAGPLVCAAVATVPIVRAELGVFDTCKAQLGVFLQVQAPFKLFDIPHPNKKEKRLRHSCLEGPEIGVYYRGRLINNNVIELPDYWNNLIDPETITVSFTPHTFYQELYVKNIEWGRKIKVVNNTGGSIDCSYIVYAERIDVDKLVIEVDEVKE